jgi:hypothetical protein
MMLMVVVVTTVTAAETGLARRTRRPRLDDVDR